jgi:hypothetical protein
MNPPRVRFVSRREQNLIGRKNVSVRAKIKGFKVAGCKLAFHCLKLAQNMFRTSRTSFRTSRTMLNTLALIFTLRLEDFADSLPNCGICSLFFFDAAESG